MGEASSFGTCQTRRMEGVVLVVLIVNYSLSSARLPVGQKRVDRQRVTEL